MENQKKIVVGILIVVLIATYVGAKTYAGKIAERKVSRAIRNVANYADVSYEKISVDLLGLNAHINNVTITPVGAKEKTVIDDIVIYDVDDKSKIPSYLHIALRGININVDSLGNDARQLKELGYNEIKANMEWNHEYDTNGKEFYLNSLSSGADKMGTIDLKFHISNINLSSENIISVLMFFPKILIHSAELSYRDDSLVSRLLEMEAKKEGKEVDSIISEITKDIDKEISRAKGELAKEVMEALKKFIKNPDKIAITVSPEEPVPVGSIQRTEDSEELLKLLNVKIRA